MPAIVTHHLFGEDASALLPEDTLTSQEELVAFLQGNQGPDPLWARFSCVPSAARACHDAARLMHRYRVVDTLCALYDGASLLRAEDAPIGRAFALGFAAHYLLDSMTHPLVYAQIAELCEASPELVGSEKELHALIESDIDVWMLWQKRQKTIREVSAAATIASMPRIDRITGEMVSRMAAEVHDVHLGRQAYGGALRDYRLIYRLIDPPAHLVPDTLEQIERAIRGRSRIETQRHVVSTSDDCASANLLHHAWRNPFTGELSFASFADLFHDALLAWPTFALRLIQGDRGRLAAMVDGLDYYGMPS